MTATEKGLAMGKVAGLTMLLFTAAIAFSDRGTAQAQDAIWTLTCWPKAGTDTETPVECRVSDSVSITRSGRKSLLALPLSVRLNDTIDVNIGHKAEMTAEGKRVIMGHYRGELPGPLDSIPYGRYQRIEDGLKVHWGLALFDGEEFAVEGTEGETIYLNSQVAYYADSARVLLYVKEGTATTDSQTFTAGSLVGREFMSTTPFVPQPDSTAIVPVFEAALLGAFPPSGTAFWKKPEVIAGAALAALVTLILIVNPSPDTGGISVPIP